MHAVSNHVVTLAQAAWSRSVFCLCYREDTCTGHPATLIFADITTSSPPISYPLISCSVLRTPSLAISPHHHESPRPALRRKSAFSPIIARWLSTHHPRSKRRSVSSKVSAHANADSRARPSWTRCPPGRRRMCPKPSELVAWCALLPPT